MSPRGGNDEVIPSDGDGDGEVVLVDEHVDVSLVDGDVEVVLVGGNVGGAVRVGPTVRRPVGPWTPAVHALLTHLTDSTDSTGPTGPTGPPGPTDPTDPGRPGLHGVPRVLGHDAAGREILTFLPGRVIDPETESLTPAQIVSLVRWTRSFHEAVAGFDHPGPWRFFPVEPYAIIGHNDIAPYNVCFDGDDLVGVFDWDLAGPSSPLFELAFIAWNCVPLWRADDPAVTAARLDLIASTYGEFTALEILDAVPPRIQLMLDGIPVAAAAGDPGMANLMTLGEPDRSARSLAELVDRFPSIKVHLRPPPAAAHASSA